MGAFPQCFFWFRAFPVYVHYRLTEVVMKAKGLSQVGAWAGRERRGKREKGDGRREE